MATKTSTGTKAARGAGESERLPESMAAFRRVVAAARTEKAREELLVRVRRELPRYESVVLSGKLPEVGRTPEGRRFEARLLEFVRMPKVNRKYDGSLHLSHSSAWGDLVDVRSGRFAAMLRRWISDADAILAAEAGKHLAQMGMDADMARVAGALERGMWRMRREVGLGLELGAESGLMSERFRRRVFDAVVPLVCGEVAIPRTWAAEFALNNLTDGLVAMDRREALAVLSSSRALHGRNGGIREVLLKLDHERENRPRQFPAVDPGLLWPVYEALRDGRLRLREDREGAKRGRVHQAMGTILSLAADRDPIRTTRECRGILRDKKGAEWEWLRLGAKAALKRCRNVPEPDAVLHAHWKGRAKFRGEALNVVQAYALLDHVLSDGLLAYFDNMGDDWAAAHEGLLAIGEKDAAGIVAEGARAVMAFASREARGSVRAAALAMDDAATAKLEALNDRFYKHIDRVRTAVERYIAEHPGAFQAVAPRRGKGTSRRG